MATPGLISNLYSFDMGLQAAVGAPRMFFDGGETKLEHGDSDAVRQELTDLGHEVSTPSMPIGGAQAIRIHQNGVLEGASDPRKDGCAIGILTCAMGVGWVKTHAAQFS